MRVYVEQSSLAWRGKKVPSATQNGATPERIVPEVSIPSLKAFSGKPRFWGCWETIRLLRE
jgi:hypothetical protein